LPDKTTFVNINLRPQTPPKHRTAWIKIITHVPKSFPVAVEK